MHLVKSDAQRHIRHRDRIGDTGQTMKQQRRLIAHTHPDLGRYHTDYKILINIYRNRYCHNSTFAFRLTLFQIQGVIDKRTCVKRQFYVAILICRRCFDNYILHPLLKSRSLGIRECYFSDLIQFGIRIIFSQNFQGFFKAASLRGVSPEVIHSAVKPVEEGIICNHLC